MANFNESFAYSNGNIWGNGTWIQSTFGICPQVSSNTLTFPVDFTQTQGTRGSYAAFTSPLSTTDWTFSFTLQVNYTGGTDDQHILEFDIGTPGANGFTLRMNCGDSTAINNLASFRIRDSNSNVAIDQVNIAFTSNVNHTVAISFEHVTGTMTLKIDGSTIDSVAGCTINNDSSTILDIFGETFNSGVLFIMDDIFFGVPTSPPFVFCGDYV